VHAREVWVQLLAKLNIATLAPTPTACRLESWWHVARQVFSKKAQRNFDAPVILGSWRLWKNRNNWVFGKVFGNVSQQWSVHELASLICDEFKLWTI
jgi:hypothetical protein